MSFRTRLNVKARRIAVLTVMLTAATAYVSCYVALRNRGLREAEQFELGVPGFFYDSCANLEKSHDLSTHHFRATLFAPLNYLDRTFFGGKGPIKGVLWELT